MENQRIRLSKSMLKSGLLTLLKVKEINQITVLELCTEAQINRTTFYKYYGSPIDLLNEIQLDFLNQLDEALKPIIAQDGYDLLHVLNYLYEQRDVFCLLVRSVPSHDFSTNLFSIASIRIIFQNMTSEHAYSETETKYIRQFLFQGTFSVLYDWLNSKNPEPAAEIAKVLGLLKSKI